MAKLIVVLLAVFASAAMANARTCFCEIRTSTDRNDPIFLDVQNPIYRHWLHFTCSTAKERCPDDCRNHAANTLGGNVNPLDKAAASTACNRLGKCMLLSLSMFNITTPSGGVGRGITGESVRLGIYRS
ncbi:uncharacterized protein LOC144863111 [Branchiostoma floridae x Branchiostoma japonicum]